MIQFLLQLLKRFVGWEAKSDLPKVVADHEPLARFVFSSEHFAQTKGLVKPKAFLPDASGETSVFRVDGLNQTDIWSIGDGIREVKAKAYGRLIVSTVRRIGLKIQSATEDHPRHAVLVGWSSEKDERLMVALELSKASSLHVHP